jgi:hypothetical protein
MLILKHKLDGGDDDDAEIQMACFSLACNECD